MLSIHFRFGLPFLLPSSTSITIILFPTYSTFSLHINFNLPSCTFYDITPTCPSNSFIQYSVQLCDSTQPSQHSNFHQIQHFLSRFLHCPCLGPVLHCWSCIPMRVQPEALYMCVCVARATTDSGYQSRQYPGSERASAAVARHGGKQSSAERHP